MNHAFPIILSAPSGGGKTTIARELLRRRHDLRYSVSATTRPQREGEMDGRDYHFLTRDGFLESVRRGEFAEWAEVHGNLYGTLKREIAEAADTRHVVMDIDVQGARQFKGSYPETLCVFLLPPSIDVLLGRLRRRATEDDHVVRRRLVSAVSELAAAREYPHIIVNDDLETAIQAVARVIEGEQRRRDERIALLAHADELRTQLEQTLS